MIKKIKQVKKGKQYYKSVIYSGDKPTYRDVYNFCKEEIIKIEKNKDFILLTELYKKIEVKYNNQLKKLELLKDVEGLIRTRGQKESDEIWGT